MTTPAPGRPGALVFGPPGSGTELAASWLAERGLEARSWDGTGVAPQAAGQESDSPAALLVQLEADPLACLRRTGPPWGPSGERPRPGPSLRRLGRIRDRQRGLREQAAVVLETTWLEPPQLRERLFQIPLREADGIDPLVVLESFSFRRGVPLDAEWCLDARGLENPYWQPALRERSGLDPEVATFVLRQDAARRVLAAALELIQDPGPALRRPRPWIRVALGCTGGFHRSVALAEELHLRLAERQVESAVWHRDLSWRR